MDEHLPIDEYVFSERERAFFARYLQQLQNLQAMVQSSISLILEQQGLAGQWKLKPDASGLMKNDAMPNDDAQRI